MEILKVALIFYFIFWFARTFTGEKNEIKSFNSSESFYHIGGLEGFFEEEEVKLSLNDEIFRVFTNNQSFEINIRDIIDIRVARIGQISTSQSKGNIALAGLMFGVVGAVASSGQKEYTKHRNVAEFKYKTVDGDRYFVIGENPTSSRGTIKNLIQAINYQLEVIEEG